MTHQTTRANRPPLAAIDVGSNTIHLVVARPPTPEQPDLSMLADDLEFVRLGAGVAATGHIEPARANAALAALARLRRLAENLSAAPILYAATEVLRLAHNAPGFLARVQAEIGVELPILSGDQEAAFTFWGAISGQSFAPDQPVVVGDLGGGSLELVVGNGPQLTWRRSLPLGSGNLHDRFIHHDPPTADELAQVRACARAAFNAQAIPTAGSPTPLVIVCGGTATTLLHVARGALRLSTRQPRLTSAQIERALARLSAAPADEIARRYHVESGRAVILGAGAAVLAALLEQLGSRAMQISQRGIREGMILAYARQGKRWLEAAEAGTL